MSSEKPKTETKHPHRESHVPEEKKPKKHRLRNAALGVAAAFGLGGLAAGGCAPSARAQETTPRQTPAVAVTPTTRVAGAETSTERRPYPPTVVAQATPPSTHTVGYDQAAAGGPLPTPEGRMYQIDTSTQQPTPISVETAREEYSYMFQNRLVQGMQTLNEGQTFRAGDWEVQSTQYGDLIVRNQTLGYEVASTASIGPKVGILPFPETEYAKGPMLFIAGNGFAEVFYLNKLTNKVGYCLIVYGNLSGQPEVGTDVFNGDPYLVVAPPRSVSQNGDIPSGTRLFQFSILASRRDGDNPGAGASYYIVE